MAGRAALSTVLPVLGDTTFNICMNDRAYWHNVAAAVWGMTTSADIRYLRSGCLSPIPPNCAVAVREWYMRGMAARLSGRFWTVRVSGRSAVVAWSPSVRGRTQQETLVGPSCASLGDVGLVGG